MDRLREPGRRHRRALPVRRTVRMVSGHRRHPLQDHQQHQGDCHHQPEQPHRRTLPKGSAPADRRHRARTPAHHLLRRNLRSPRHGRPAAHLHRLDGPGPVLRDLLRPVEIAHDRRLPHRLDDPVRQQAHCQGLHRGPQHARQHAHVFERARPVRGADRARRPPERQRLHRAGRPRARPARPRLRHAQPDPRHHRRQAEGRVLHLPEDRRQTLQHPLGRAVRARPAA